MTCFKKNFKNYKIKNTAIISKSFKVVCDPILNKLFSQQDNFRVNDIMNFIKSQFSLVKCQNLLKILSNASGCGFPPLSDH